ncbi:MAG: hypothetical protein AAFW95_13565 [Cyanobacteria bacterium J06638_6]
MPEATAYSIYTTNTLAPHQVWYRIAGGNALFRQRLRVYQENAAPRPINHRLELLLGISCRSSDSGGSWLMGRGAAFSW